MEVGQHAAFSTYTISALIGASIDTLEALSVPFDETYLLPNFLKLERLELLHFLPDLAGPVAEVLPSTLTAMYGSLKRMPSLTTLLLTDSNSPSPESVLPSPVELARSLPPTLVSLSLEKNFLPDDLLSFITHLPPTSNLRRLNLRFFPDDVPETSALDTECEQRGIELTIVRAWSIQ
jgi:hypothetical protein